MELVRPFVGHDVEASSASVNGSSARADVYVALPNNFCMYLIKYARSVIAQAWLIGQNELALLIEDPTALFAYDA